MLIAPLLTLVVPPATIVPLLAIAILSFLIGTGLAIAFTFKLPPWRWTQIVRTRRLAAARCPACTYELGQSPPRTEDLVICPECGAAWQWPE